VGTLHRRWLFASGPVSFLSNFSSPYLQPSPTKSQTSYSHTLTLSHSLTVPSLASRHLVNTLRFSIDGRRLELDCNNLRSHNHHGVRTALVQLTPAPLRSTKLIPVAIAWEPRYFQSHNICGMVEMLHFLTYSGHPNISTHSFSRDTATCQRLRTVEMAFIHFTMPIRPAASAIQGGEGRGAIQTPRNVGAEKHEKGVY
jgi:hypothetical protein